MNKLIPLCEPFFQGNEWRYVKDCLDTGWVSSVGSYVTRFENDICDYTGANYAVATSSGTAALHLSLLLVGVKAEDEVLVPSLTFIAPANAIRYIGASPVFIDCEPNYWQMDPGLIKKFLEKECKSKNGSIINKKTGRRVAAILPVHVLGHPVDLDQIFEISKKYNIPIVEDATESLGASYKDKKIGSIGDVACFSFNGNKMITSGGGGMIVTRKKSYAKKAKYLANQAKDDPIEYIHKNVGYNYGMTNIQAALGVAQLEKLDKHVSKKRDIAKHYNDAFADIEGIEIMQQAPYAKSAFWMYTILVDRKKFGINSRALLDNLKKRNIQCRPIWQPLHASPVYKTCQNVGVKISNKLNRDALSIPCSVGLSSRDQQYVIKQILQESSN